MDTDVRPHFTHRERELITGIVAGRSNRQIAERLGLKEQTVRNRLTVIFAKCGVRTRLQLALRFASDPPSPPAHRR